MFTSFLIIKICISIVLVLFLVFVSERISPKIAGIIGGTPIGGTAVVLVFFALEHGTSFVASVIPWSIAGLGGEIGFYGGYYLGSRIFPTSSNRLLHIASSIVVASILLVSIGSILTLIPLNLPLALAIFFICSIAGNYFIKNIRVEHALQPAQSTLPQIGIRILVVTALIILITGGPYFLSDRWSGIFSSFPTTIFPLLLILQFSYGNKAFPSVIKNITWSLSTLVFYLVAIYFLYSVLGIAVGTALAFGLSFLYLLGIRSLIKNFAPHFYSLL